MRSDAFLGYLHALVFDESISHFRLYIRYLSNFLITTS